MNRRFFSLLIAVLMIATLISAQEQHAGAPQARPVVQQNASENAQSQGEGAKGREAAQKAASQGGVGAELAKASREAAAEGGENAQFKESPSVRFVASITGMSLRTAYWISILLNFAILAVLVVLFSKSKLPAMFRTRTGEIQRGITEARKASEDANRRLADIEARLSRLDTDVAKMRAAAEEEALAEERRLQQSAEEESRKVVSAAASEIAAAAKLARRELKAYSAELAIALAEKRIHVDSDTDRALVSNFVEQLNSPESAGKDGK